VKAWFDARGRGPVQVQVGRAGQFEILADGQTVYSKAQTGRFPSEADLAALAE
jgi:selT/selW/selH-like putative selenoprotein